MQQNKDKGQTPRHLCLHTLWPNCSHLEILKTGFLVGLLALALSWHCYRNISSPQLQSCHIYILPFVKLSNISHGWQFFLSSSKCPCVMCETDNASYTHTPLTRGGKTTHHLSVEIHTLLLKNILVNAGKKTLIGINTALWVKFQQAIYVERLFVSSFTVNVNFEAVWLYTDKKKHNFLSHTVWLTHEHWDCAASFVTSALQLNQTNITNISHFILKQPTGNGSI